MKKPLLDVIFASEKRKNVLLFLHEAAKEMPLILDHLNTSRPALLPQMRILEKHNLIWQSNDTYGLTGTGKLIADEISPFLEKLETLDENRKYLTTHKVDSIPEHLLKRINEVKGSKLIEPSHVNSHEMNAEYLQVALSSRAVYFVFTFMHPACPSILGQLADNGIHVEIIFTKELVEKLIEEWYDEFRYYLAYGNIRIHLYEKEVRISSLTVTDTGFLLRLLFNNNEFSNKQLICGSPEGRQWGKELYDHYLKDAILITEI